MSTQGVFENAVCTPVFSDYVRLIYGCLQSNRLHLDRALKEILLPRIVHSWRTCTPSNQWILIQIENNLFKPRGHQFEENRQSLILDWDGRGEQCGVLTLLNLTCVVSLWQNKIFCLSDGKRFKGWYFVFSSFAISILYAKKSCFFFSHDVLFLHARYGIAHNVASNAILHKNYFSMFYYTSFPNTSSRTITHFSESSPVRDVIQIHQRNASGCNIGDINE